MACECYEDMQESDKHAPRIFAIGKEMGPRPSVDSLGLVTDSEVASHSSRGTVTTTI